jgi:hypothetical protein
MKAVYFYEDCGVKYYKCDTFWSTSRDITHAKIHDDSRVDDFLRSLIDSKVTYPSWNEETILNNMFRDILYGYQTFEESELKNQGFQGWQGNQGFQGNQGLQGNQGWQFSLKENPKILNTHYIKKIIINSPTDYKIIDYREIIRNEKISDILGED